MVWRRLFLREAYWARIDGEGRELERVDRDLCSRDGLVHTWLFSLDGFKCALKSPVDEQIFFLVPNEECGVPENAYYRWQRRGLGERASDFRCVMRIRGNDTLYLYVDDSCCATR